MSLFKKPNRRFRQRRTEDDSDEDEGGFVERESNKQQEAKWSHDSNENCGKESSQKENKTKHKLKLSFDEEEEEVTAFKVKKSSYSRRMEKHYEKEKRKREKAREENKEITLSKEKKVAIEKSESVEGSVRKKMEKEKEELSIKWISSQVPIRENTVSDKEMHIENVDSNDDEDQEDEDSGDIRHSKSSLHQFRGVLERGVIPDAKTIYALKKQRQMARDAVEFISVVDNDSKLDDNKSRLVRDDDNDKSGEEDDEDEDDDRIDFAVNKEALEKEKAREAFLQAQEEEDENMVKGDGESDDELDKWEQEQIRKGIGVQNQANLLALGSSQLSDDSNSLSMFASRNVKNDYSDFKRKSNTIPEHLLKSRKRVSREDVLQKLNESLRVLRLNLESNEREMINVGIEIERGEENLKRLESEMPRLVKQFQQYQQMYMSSPSTSS